MKTDMRTILRDIQAAARIGHVESLWAALDQLQDIPQIGGNHPLDETLINQVVLPVGKALSRMRITHAAMQPLIRHPFAAYRAAAGVALVTRFLDGSNNTTLKDINGLVQDPRADVRLAIQMAVTQITDPDQDKLEALYTTWQRSDSPRIQALAYQILPHLPEEMILEQVRTMRDRIRRIPGRGAQHACQRPLSTWRRRASEGVLEILSNWAAQEDPDYRMVAGSLSKPWAAEHPEKTLEILTQLAGRVGAKKRIRKALENLNRNGAEELVAAVLESWRNAENPNLKAAGSDEKLNI